MNVHAVQKRALEPFIVLSETREELNWIEVHEDRLYEKVPDDLFPIGAVEDPHHPDDLYDSRHDEVYEVLLRAATGDGVPRR